MNLGSSGELQSAGKSFDRSEGLSFNVHYEGTQAYINDLFTLLKNQSRTCEISHKGPLWKLDAKLDIGQLNAADVTVDVRMQVNSVQKSIFEPPGPTGISDEDLRLVKAGLDENFDPSLDGVSDAALALYDLALKGVTERVVYQPIISVTRTAGYAFQFPNRYSDVGSNLSESVMMADAEIQGLLQFSLPVFSAALPSDFTYGWVKHMPFYDQAVGQRTVEYLQYEFGAWSNLLYPLVG